MSSTTRLLVLGVVKLFQPVHGYVVRRELISWRAQEWASVQPGSIYNALKTLTRDGLLEVASTDQVGGRPERTTYRLTTAGTEEFHTLLREEWWNVRTPVDPMMAAVSFLSALSRAEAISALEHRIAQIHGMVRQLEFAIDGHDGAESPLHVREMMRLMNARVAAEIAWSEQFIERLKNREYDTADEPPWQPPAKPATGGARRTAGRRRGPAPRARSAPAAERANRGRRREAQAQGSATDPASPASASMRRDRAGSRASPQAMPRTTIALERDASRRSPERADRRAASQTAPRTTIALERDASASRRSPERGAPASYRTSDRAPPRRDRWQTPNKRGKRSRDWQSSRRVRRTR